MRRPLHTTIAATSMSAALLLAACGSDDGDGNAASDPTTSTTAAAPGTTATPPDTTMPSGEADAEATDTVEAWVAALADGDLDTAWELVHPSSQEAFGGREAFDQSASAFAEGYGAWAAVDELELATIDLGDLAPDVVVVALQGTLRQEGTTTADAAAAIPVRTDGDRPLVDPFHQLAGPVGLELGDPDGSVIAPDHRFGATGPAGADLALFVGDERLETTSVPVDGGRELYEGRPAEPLTDDAVVATVVIVGPDGAVQVDAAGYSVSG